MAAPALQPITSSTDAEQALRALDAVRAGTSALVGHLSDEQLERVFSPIMSPLVWDLGHIAAYEDLWLCCRHAGMELLKPELADVYDAFETPRAVRGEIETLNPDEAREYMAAVRERTARALAEHGLGDGVICEMVLRHELQHSETMRQTLAIAGLLPAGDRSKIGQPLQPLAGADAWIEMPAGPFELGAGPDGFAYDNERPQHTVELPAFQIARRPVTNASWERFSAELADSLGAETADGRSESTRDDLLGKGKHTADGLHPDAPVCHVSWFEADAFARAHDARLPTEAEWEKAASSGLLTGVGAVWEWTASRFDGYPGFVAYPYREYSEVFFGEDYRVLRGGSWATHPRVATLTFRNWDLPQRRQIFAGVRLVKDIV